MRFVSGPCSETQPASASSHNGRGKRARALMEARGRYPVRRAAVPTRATGERREHERAPDEWAGRYRTPRRLSRVRLGGRGRGRGWGRMCVLVGGPSFKKKKKFDSLTSQR